MVGTGATLFAVSIALVATLGGLFGGPALGDHEAIVAQCARDMRLSGDWIVPRFLDTEFVRKPPLGYWLVAAASYLFPNDTSSGLPVTTTVARLPSALAAFGTILLLWKLAAAMFSKRAGVVTAVVSSTSVFALLYAPNATVEMLLTFCCTWAFAHFWFAVTAQTAARRALHMFFFYIALGAGMLAKGPAPLALVAVPLAFWWYSEEAQGALADGGRKAIRKAQGIFLRGLWPRTAQVFTRLWIFPGILLFLAVFVPWMLAVAKQSPAAWDIWNWQYLQRFQGDYEDTRYRGPWYYLPIALGLIAPWTVAVVEGLVAPWRRRFQDIRRPLYFVGIWCVVGVAVMSAMEFKKPYYIMPAVPGFLLLIGVIIDGLLYEGGWSKRWNRAAWMGVIAIPVTAAGAACFWPALARVNESPSAVPVAMIVVLGCAAAAWGFLKEKKVTAIGSLTVSIVAGFLGAWYMIAPSLNNISRVAALDKALDQAGVANNAPVYWVDQRPDSRLSFYFQRPSKYLIDPSEIVAQSVVRKKQDEMIVDMAIARADELVEGQETEYLILDREHMILTDRLKPKHRDRLHKLGEIDLDGIQDDDDWVILTTRMSSQ